MNENGLKRRWQREDDFAIDTAIIKAMEQREGRKFLWWLLQIGRIGYNPFAGNALNTAFTCGELNVGQQVLDRIITVSPDGYLLMMKENNDEVRERNGELRTLDNPTDDAGADDGETAPST